MFLYSGENRLFRGLRPAAVRYPFPGQVFKKQKAVPGARPGRPILPAPQREPRSPRPETGQKAALDKTAHPPLNTRYARYRSSRLRPGALAAHGDARLMLLGSPPDMVHGAPLRETGPSTLLTAVRRHIASPGAGIHPCCSVLQVQGTAGSPTSAALSRAAELVLYMIVPAFARDKQKNLHFSYRPSSRMPPGKKSGQLRQSELPAGQALIPP